MTTQTEARELAQRFGVRMCDENGDTHGEELYCLGLDDIIAIKEALAQPEQEPVGEAYLCDLCHTPFDGAFQCPSCGHGRATKEPLYTTPPQRKPLTYVDLRRIANQCGLGANEVSARTQATVDNYARAIEAAHGIKE